MGRNNIADIFVKLKRRNEARDEIKRANECRIILLFQLLFEANKIIEGASFEE